METFFLACFVFGALFTAASAVMGFVGSGMHGGHAGAFHHAGHDALAGGSGHGGHDLLTDGLHQGGHDASAGSSHVAPGHGDAVATGHQGEQTVSSHAGHGRLPLFNLSSLLGFLTWFGAAGYLLLKFAAWPPIFSLAVAVLAGGTGALAVSLFLAKVLAGERVMDPRDYRLEGTIARVTIGIPEEAVGEIVFSKAGTRRSEAARSFSGLPVQRDTEVVIVRYDHGVATVEPLEGLAGPDGAATLEPRNPQAGSVE